MSIHERQLNSILDAISHMFSDSSEPAQVLLDAMQKIQDSVTIKIDRLQAEVTP